VSATHSRSLKTSVHTDAKRSRDVEGRKDTDTPGESATSITKDLNGLAEAHVGGEEAHRGKPSRLEAIAYAFYVSVAVANLAVVPAILSFVLKYGVAVPAVAVGIILALSIAAGALSAWTLGKHRLHGHFLGSYALALASIADKASPEGILLTTILPITYIAGIAHSITE